MKKVLIISAMFFVFTTINAQTKADSTKVNQLSQKIEQLKNQIITQEAQLYEGEKQLQAMINEYKLNQLALENITEKNKSESLQNKTQEVKK
jgi:predicted  nucleic acid-binding Zn-ribbon protein